MSDYITANVMLSLGGEFMFSVNTAAWASLKRSADYRWVKQERLGREPALQFVGNGSQTITISGVIYPHYKGGINQLDKMREAAAKGEPLMLADGLGYLLGNWVIDKVDENKTIPASNGYARKIEFSLTISKYGDD